jgi:arylsulfatase A-like enzyme
VADAGDLEIPFGTPGETPVSFLGVRLEPPADASISSSTKALIQLPPKYLDLAESPRGVADSSPPAIFIYMIDTLRADALEPYGSGQKTSPRISKFSKQAVTYLDAWAPSSWTLPSVASLFTGLFPSRQDMGQAEHKLSGVEVRTLAGLLANSGYQTLGISHSHVASAAFGIDSGFEQFFLSNHLNGWQLRSQEIRRLLLMLLATADNDRPLFSYLHTVDPHAPYYPRGDDRRLAREHIGQLPEKKYLPMPFILEDLKDNEPEIAHLQALYLGEVLFADRQFGLFLDLLDQLSLLDGSLIVLLSDHGEEFGEHGSFDHGRTVYQEMLRVPLLIQFPNPEWSGERIHRRVSLLDVLPTVLLAAGVSVSDITLDGRALRPDLLAVQGPRPTIAETHAKPSVHRGPVELQALSIEAIKCIHSSTGLDQFANPMPEWQTFDLGSDPGESRPLAPKDAAHKDCVRTLTNWLEARSTWKGIPDADATEVDEEALETLRALGYIQ